MVTILLSLPATAADTFEGHAYYLGDLHAHTGYSGDGSSAEEGCASCGAQSDVIAAAMANGLDFVAITDHVNGSTDTGTPQESEGDFALGLATVLAGSSTGDGFLTIPAAEVFFATPDARYGHKTLLMFGDDATLASLPMSALWPGGDIDYQTLSGCSDIETWADGLSASYGPVVLVPHHPAVYLPMLTDWSCHSNDYEVSAEVYSSHGTSLERAPDFDRPTWFSGHGTVAAAMDPNLTNIHTGFVGGTDRHDSAPGLVTELDLVTNQPYGGGLTMVVLDESDGFDRDAVHQAIVDRRTYATSGPAVSAWVEWRSGNVLLGELGDEIVVPSGQDVDVTVRVDPDYAAMVDAVQLRAPGGRSFEGIDQGDGVWTVSVTATSMQVYLYATVKLDGTAYWGSTPNNDGGSTTDEYLWLSPSWITSGPGDLDADGVGYLDGDCDDGDPLRGPNQTEVWYDGVDQDCDGKDDDQDDDGYDLDQDCDDLDPERNNGNTEIWYDGIDEACDAGDDYDADGDGHRSLGWGGDDCDDGDATVTPPGDCTSVTDRDQDGHESIADGGDDCDDTNSTAFPGAPEVWYDGIDQDCDRAWDFDRDGDLVAAPLDCDDGDALVGPYHAEIWYDGVDQDCDGNDADQDLDGWQMGDDCDDRDDDAFPGANDAAYDGIDSDCAGDDDYDADRDGFTSAAYGGDDCDDARADTYPGAYDSDPNDGVDESCSGIIGEDADGDGHGSADSGGDDCDDARSDVFPGAVEIWYDHIDQDCDGNDIDQDYDSITIRDDCDDTDPSVNPRAEEIWYDGVDQNCDGNDADQDGDGSAWPDDCDDTDVDVYPGNAEIWYDGVDGDCSGGIDDDQDYDGALLAIDCDDTNPELGPQAVDIAADGIDQDCDGFDAQLDVDPPDTDRNDPKSCGGCSSGSGGGTVGLGGLIGALALIRRLRR